MPKRSYVLGLAAAIVLAGGAGATVAVVGFGGTETVTMRVWDEQVAKAYETSFAEFHAENPRIRVKLDVVPWSDYWTTLRADIADRRVDDVFWVNGGNFESYAADGDLMDITKELGASAQREWQADVVEQYTRDGSLWGVPQLADPGIALFYNEDLLEEAGLTPADLQDLRWDPSGKDDTLLPVLRRLTVDAAGTRADQPGFDPSRIVQYGFNAGNDPNAIYLNFLGSNGAAFQDGTEFVFASPEGEQAFQYLVDLVNKYHVAPPAAETNTNGNFSRDQFLQGRMALFQSGSYNLANVQQGAAFAWGLAPMPAGPKGAVSVTNGIVAAGNAHTSHPQAVRKVLKWLGSTAGSIPIGAKGAASPAVLGAQPAYLSYWESRGVDVGPMFDVLAGGTVQAPQGANWGAAEEAFRPVLEKIFLGRVPVAEGLAEAQSAANRAMRR